MHNHLPEKRVISHKEKLVFVISCIIFALFSTSIPAFHLLHAKELQETQTNRELTRTTTVAVQKTNKNTSYQTIAKTQHIALKREKRRISPTPTLTPTPKIIVKEKKETSDKKTEENTEKIENENSVQAASFGGSQKDLLQALNSYRAKKGKSALSWDTKLGGFAQMRAEKFASDNKMDSHAGFQEMFRNNGHQEMGFLKMGENSSMSDNIDYTYIIESLYAGSSGHDANQLNDEYTYVGVGVSGKYTNIVFGGKKL